jgi:hypothetical protein
MLWSAKVKSFRGALVKVTVQAPDCMVALALLRQLYGRSNVAVGPSSVPSLPIIQPNAVIGSAPGPFRLFD